MHGNGRGGNGNRWRDRIERARIEGSSLPPAPAGLFTPDFAVPSFRREVRACGELRLVAELVCDAANIVSGYTASTPAERASARDWIRFGNCGAVTFDQCCEFLGLEPALVRRALAIAMVAR